MGRFELYLNQELAFNSLYWVLMIIGLLEGGLSNNLSIPYIGFMLEELRKPAPPPELFQFPILGSWTILFWEDNSKRWLSIPYIGFRLNCAVPWWADDLTLSIPYIGFLTIWFVNQLLYCFLSIPYIGFSFNTSMKLSTSSYFQFPILGSKSFHSIFPSIYFCFQFPILGSWQSIKGDPDAVAASFNSLYWVLCR